LGLSVLVLLNGEMWHCHILDVVNYCHDMMLLCGHVVGHNPDGALDYIAKQKRDDTTRASLIDHFGSYDEDVWDYSPDAASETEGTEDSNYSESESGAHQDDPITIRVRGQAGGVQFVVKRSTKIVKVFDAYAAKMGGDLSDLRFEFDGERIDFDPNDDTADSLGLEDDDEIDCFIIAQPDAMMIFVKTLTGKTVPLLARPTDSVGSVKEALWKREGYPPEQQRLIFAGRPLEDERTLDDYKISSDCAIHLVLKLGGC